jgi:CSLREA domain-containing protein
MNIQPCPNQSRSILHRGRFSGRKWASILAALVLACASALLLSTVTWALGGPVATPPGGVTVTPSDPTGRQIGITGGISYTYSGFDFGQFKTLYWGAVETGTVGFAFDGTINQPGEVMTFTLAGSDLDHGMAQWTGSSRITCWVGYGWTDWVLPTRFTLRVTDASGDPIPLVQGSALGLPGDGVVMTVTGDFTAWMLVETDNSGWQPALEVFNSLQTISGLDGQVSTRFDGQFYYEDIPASGLVATNDSPTALGSTTLLTASVVSGTNVTYAWAFGDGESGNGVPVGHIYPAVGVYTAVVTATNSTNALTVTTQVTITDAPIIDLVAFNDSPTRPGWPTTLTATISAGSNVTYTWAFDDGALGSGRVITHVYSTAGAYTALVTATNSVSWLTATTTVSIPFQVQALFPTAGEVSAAPGTLISATFNSALDTGSVTSTTLRVWGAQTGFHTGTYAFPAADQASFDAAMTFKPSELIAATAISTVHSSNGMALIPYVWQFRAAVGSGSGHFMDSGQILGNSEGFGVALGDLDGDGDLDAYVVNENSQPDLVWLNDGAGHFSDSGQRLGSAAGREVVLGDLDGDGDLDAVVANSGPNEVWVNDGTGVFTDTGQHMGGSQNSYSVGLGDLDGDGDLDAYFANGSPTGTPDAVWLNDGTGVFTDTGQPLGTGYTHGVALGDVDSDGDLDAFTTNWGQSNVLWLNNGHGYFIDSGQNPGGPANNLGVALGDLDGDGDLDAYVSTAGSNTVWLNDGGGYFSDSGQALGSAYSFRVALGDVDNDGDLDAFVANNTSQPNKVWLNDGHAAFYDSGQSMGSISSISVALGDMDGDGDLDAFVTNQTAQPDEVWLNQVGVKSLDPAANTHGAAASTNLTVTMSGVLSQSTVTSATVKVHAGFQGRLTSTLGVSPSLVVADPSSNFHPGELLETSVTTGVLDSQGTRIAPYVWRFRAAVGGGSGRFADSGQALGAQSGYGVALGDLDGDGDLDAFVANTNWPSGQPNQVWLNDGSGVFTDSGQTLGISNTLRVALGDLDGDGDLDAFVANGNNEPNEVWWNDGAAHFTDSGQALGSSESYDVELGDLDGDGDLDAFIATYNTQPDEVWLNDGAGHFTDSGQALGSEYGQGMALGDVDGDGDLDAYVANCHGSALDKLWLNDGSGHFTDSGQTLDGMCSYKAALGDVDGDDDLDVFVVNGSQPSAVWLNDGHGHFSNSGQSLSGVTSTSVELGDLDGDGDLDAFIAIYNAELNAVWLNDGTGVFTDSGQLLGSASSRDVALGDVDGDGDLDAFIATDSVSPDEVWLNLPVPTITGFSPTSGTIGTNVIITGTNFTGTLAVRFNGVDASFIVVSATSISATVPPGATTGPVSVLAPGGTAMSLSDFTVILPTISISDTMTTEGDSGTADAAFTVTLSFASSTTATVNYTTTNGTATAGSDYVASSGLLTFTPGTMLRAITISVSGDTTDEYTETFLVNLDSPINAAIADGQGQGAIVDDDPEPSLSIGDSMVVEGDAGTVDATFVVSLSVASGKTVTVNYATADNTAVAGSDYITTSGTLTFTPGTTISSTIVSVIGDTVEEEHETFYVNLADSNHATITHAQGVGTILDDEGGIVTKLPDTDDGLCDADCSLREAITAAGSGDTVRFAPGLSGTITLSSQLVITKDLTINGPGADVITVSGNDAVRVFSVDSGVAFAIDNLTIANGSASGGGAGAIYAPYSGSGPKTTLAVNNCTFTGNIGGAIYIHEAEFTVTDSVFSTNVCEGCSAGAIFIDACLDKNAFISGSTFYSNTAGNEGGAILSFHSNLVISDSSFIGNGATSGGAIVNTFLGHLTVNSSSFISNTATSGGALYSSLGTITVINDSFIGPNTASGAGGGIYNSGTFTITASIVTSNTASAGCGGGIYNSATASIDDSVIQNNTADSGGGGGGVCNDGGTLSINRSTISGNNAYPGSGSGGGLSNNGTAMIANSTIAYNHAHVGGGILNTAGSVTLANATIANNSGDAERGIRNYGTVTLTNTIMSNIDNCTGGTFVDGGNNLQYHDATCGVTIPVADPLLGPLQDNGGDTLTMALLPGSPAIDAGNNAVCAAVLVNSVDQRGVWRPLGGSCDIGAYETHQVQFSTNALSVNENAGTAALTVTIASVSPITVTAGYTFSDGTAIAGDDYDAISGTLTFTPGVTSRAFYVPLIDDLVDEPDETFTITLSSPGGAVLGTPSTATVTIVDDDFFDLSGSYKTADTSFAGPGSLVTYTAVLSNSGNITATATLTDSIPSGIVVLTPTLTGGATYDAQENRITYDGTVLAHASHEISFVVQVGGLISGTVVVNTAQIDDGTSVITRAVSFTVVNAPPVAVDDTTSTPEDTPRIIDVLDNDTDPDNDTLIITSISTPSYGAADTNGAAVVYTPTLNYNGQDVFTYIISDGVLTDTATITVTVTAVNDPPVAVDDGGTGFTTDEDTPFTTGSVLINDTDPDTSDTLSVSGLDTSGTVGSVINNGNGTFDYDPDGQFEYLAVGEQATDAFTYTVNDGHGGTDTAVVTIIINGANDEPAVGFDRPTYSADEGIGLATFTVTLDAACASTVTVDYAASDGTAKEGDDYVSASGTLTFTPGVTSQTFTVAIIDDALDEDDETVILTLSDAHSAILDGTNPATLIIRDDDGLPTVDFGSTAYSVIENERMLTVDVILDSPSALTVTVDYATQDGTATAGGDYVAISGTLVFTPGVTSQTILVTIISDGADENDETIILTLSDAGNATIGGNSPAVLTIVDKFKVYLPLVVRNY